MSQSLHHNACWCFSPYCISKKVYKPYQQQVYKDTHNVILTPLKKNLDQTEPCKNLMWWCDYTDVPHKLQLLLTSEVKPRGGPALLLLSKTKPTFTPSLLGKEVIFLSKVIFWTFVLFISSHIPSCCHINIIELGPMIVYQAECLKALVSKGITEVDTPGKSQENH